jgi:transposase
MSRRDELIDRCRREPEKVVDLLLALEAKVASLEARLNRTSKNSDKPPSSDGLKKQPRQRSKSKRKPGGQKGHRGTTLKFSDQPDHIIPYEPACCQACGGSLDRVEGAVVSRCQEVELPEKPVQIIEHQCLEKQCPGCGCRTRGQWPEYLSGNVQYGRRFKAFCTYLLNYQLLPFERTGELLHTLCGYHPGGGTLQRMLEQAYTTLEPIEQAIKAAVRASPVGQGDETSLRVEGQTQWLHVFSSLLYTYYYWSQHRGQKAHQADGTLPEYQGILMHDAYRSYFGYGYTHALCNAHLLRELQALYETDPTQRWAWQLRRLLRLTWTWVKTAQARGDTHLSDHPRDWTVALFEQIVLRADRHNPPAQRRPGQRGRVAQSPARNLIDRLLQHQDAYLRFLTDFRVPFDNNLAERDLRMSKLQQKISGCFRTPRGTDLFCRIRGYISTLRKQGYEILPALLSLWSDTPFIPVPAE